MATARDLINRSLKLLGVLASGETASAQELNDGLDTLNDMLGSWSNENLMVPNTSPETFSLVGGKQTYTMGPSGDFNTARPLDIENINIQETTSGNLAEYPVRLVSQDEWAAIIIKSVQSTIPTVVYVDDSYPLQRLNFWPAPALNYNAIVYSQKALTNIPTIATTIDMPPGYSKAIRYNLAIELAPEYGRTAAAEIVAGAVEGRENIKRNNAETPIMGVDQALLPKGKPFNWMTGD